MSFFQAVTLGIVQGLTEFFPISSSGHLVILQSFLDLKGNQMAFDIFLHMGTLMSIIVYFRKDITGLLKDKAMIGWIVLGSIPAAILGIVFKDAVEAFFGRPRTVGYMFMLTGLWLGLASAYCAFFSKTVGSKRLGAYNSVMVGLAQGASLMPGISRSGATIATALMTGLERELAFRFSFLLSIPAVFGATVLKAKDIKTQMLYGNSVFFLIGALTAMIFGILAIKILLGVVKNNRLYLFGIYCLVSGIVVLICFR